MEKPEHLTQKETDDILKMFTLGRDHLRLNQWNIMISLYAPEDEDVIMDTTPVENHYVARIRVSKEWGSEPDAVKKDTIVHELLHLYHRDLDDMIDAMTYGDSGCSRDNAVACQAEYSLKIERMVSSLARLVADGWDQEWPPPSKTVVGNGIYVQGDHRG